MHLVIGTNPCCGCETPTFVGLYPDPDAADAAALAWDGDCKVIPVADTEIAGWNGRRPWDPEEHERDDTSRFTAPAHPGDQRIVGDAAWTPAGKLARHPQ